MQKDGVHSLIINVDCLNHPDVIKILGHDLSQLGMKARGTLHVLPPVAFKWDASRPGDGVLVSFGVVALLHHDERHYLWVSKRKREFLMSVDTSLRALVGM